MSIHQPRYITRRTAIGTIAGLTAAAIAQPMRTSKATPDIRISLAQWSLHHLLFEGDLTNLDFPAEARAMGFDAIEYVTQFFQDKALDRTYLNQLNTRAQDAGVDQILIMVDGQGRPGDPDADARKRAIDGHAKWLEAAAALGCPTIRVSAYSEGSEQEQLRLAADGLRRLAEHAETMNLSVVVENHGGLSSNAAWLARLIKRVDLPNFGTLPDFGNFRIDEHNEYDRYTGVRELMPFAKAVSAKSYAFDDRGNETTIDYMRMTRIILDAGYRGWIGVEYEGDKHTPREGARLTRALLERCLEEARP